MSPCTESCFAITEELTKCIWSPRCGWVLGTEWDLWAHLRQHAGIFRVLLQARLPAAHWWPHLRGSVTPRHSFTSHCCLPTHFSHLNRLIYHVCSRDKNYHEYLISLSHFVCVCLCVWVFPVQTQVDVLRPHFEGLVRWESQTQLGICCTAEIRASRKDVYLVSPCVCAQTLMNVNSRMAAALTPAPTLQEDTLATALLLCC